MQLVHVMHMDACAQAFGDEAAYPKVEHACHARTPEIKKKAGPAFSMSRERAAAAVCMFRWSLGWLWVRFLGMIEVKTKRVSKPLTLGNVHTYVNVRVYSVLWKDWDMFAQTLRTHSPFLVPMRPHTPPYEDPGGRSTGKVASGGPRPGLSVLLWRGEAKSQ